MPGAAGPVTYPTLPNIGSAAAVPGLTTPGVQYANPMDAGGLAMAQSAASSRHREQNAVQAVGRWIKHWSSRQVVPVDPHTADNRAALKRERQGVLEGMFVLRLRSAVDLILPLAAGDRVPKSKWPEARRAAEREAASALSLRLRVSFLDSPGGLLPSLYGHSTLSPKLTVQSAEVLSDNTTMGKLKVTVLCQPQPIFFFRADVAGPDKQAVLEVLADVEPVTVPFPQTGHRLIRGEGIRIRADGWTGTVGGGVSFTVDLRTAIGISLRWAPCVDGESVLRNCLVGGAWGVPDISGGWPHHCAAPVTGSIGGPLVLDFRFAATHWEVWVDGDRQPDFDFPHACRDVALDIAAVMWSQNLINPQACIIPRDPQERGAPRTQEKGLDVAPRLWCVDPGAAATAKPRGASVLKHEAGELFGKQLMISFGWMCLRFDNASESKRAEKGQLRLGSLYDWLLPHLDPKTRQARPVNHDIHAFLAKVESQQVGTVDYDFERIQMESSVRRLFPLDFPAFLRMARLGGITSNADKGWLALHPPDACDCFLRDVCVQFPDDRWLEDFKQAVEFTDPAARREPNRQLEHLELRAGSHNSLRWLDEAISRQLGQQANVPDMAVRPQGGVMPDKAGHTWCLTLVPESAGQLRRWTFRGEGVPIQFVCDVECALVLELVAVISSSKRGSVQSLAAEATGTPHLQTQSIGWILILPLEHTSDEALRRAADASLQRIAPVIYYDTEVMQQQDAISGNKVFRWKKVANQPQHSPPIVSFGLIGDSFLRWLQRKRTPIEIPQELKSPPRPSTLPAELLPQPQQFQQQQDAATQALLQRPGDALTLQNQDAATQALLQKPGQQAAQQAADEAAIKALAGQTSGLPLPPAPPPAPAPPGPPPAQPWTVQPPWATVAPPPELQTVVERIYLRDQGTQSDPPAIPGMEDQLIGDGRAIPPAAAAAMAGGPAASPPRPGQPYAGPAARPLPGGSASRLTLDLGETGASRILQGMPFTKAAPRREMRWRLEDDDPLQADEVTIEFLAYRSFAGTVSERVHFQLRFFVFPPLKTSSAVLAGGPGEACMLRSAVTNDRLALVYLVDGATRGAASEVHRQLAEFLSARSAEVEVWNSDSAMQVGTVSVPLEPLVRQGHQVTKVEGEFPVLDPMTGETRGSIQVLLACRGRTPSSRPPVGQQPGPPLPGAINTSIMSEANTTLAGASMLAAGGAPGAAANITLQASERERGRVRHKAQALIGAGGASAMASSVAFPDEAAKKRQRLKQLRMIRGTNVTERFSEHTALLSAAEEERVDRKRAEVAKRMDRFNTSQLTVLAPFAHSSFFSFEFSNPYSQQAAFIVTIAEPQRPPVAGGPAEVGPPGAVGIQAGAPKPAAASFAGILQEPPDEAMALVKDPQEWRRLVIDRKVPPPPGGEYAIFNAMGHFTVKPGETVVLPFRYLAFNHPTLAAAAEQAPAGGVTLPDAEAQTAHVPDRIFVIEVLVHQGPTLKRVEVTARAQPCVVDKTIRFFEVEGTPVEKTLALPSRPALCGLLRGSGQRTTDVGEVSQAGFLATSMDRQADRYVYCTDKEVHLQWKDEDSLQVRLLAPMSPAVRRFFVLCYADPHFMRVGAAQLVEIHAMKSEHVRVLVGHNVDRIICLPPVEVLDTALVQGYSSDPEMLIARKAAEVDPRYGAKLEVTISATRAGTRTCRLHAVDPATRHRVAAFLVVVAADMPEVRMAHDITLPVNMTMRKHLRYKNETMRPLRYNVKSSDPAIVTVQTPELMLPGGDTRVIELLFHAQPVTMTYSAEVYLFVASEDRAIQETRLLQLTYT